MALNPLFLNQCFDKNRLKNLITWSLLTVGEKRTIETVENLKALGFQFATQAGVSLGVDDLKIPPEKLSLVSQASQQVEATQQAYRRGDLTAIEKLQQLVDTWHRTSETLKQTVVNYFQSTDKLSPVYMMAFSGARGNISQVRQLAGMRGLMADPQGQIIGFPIRSNFREGLTLTEYMISCYGARKGLVDTALRTADAGYLTRRLIDVSQHMIVKAATCATPRGIVLKDLQSATKVILPLRERLIGRVLAEDVLELSSTPDRSDSRLSSTGTGRTASSPSWGWGSGPTVPDQQRDGQGVKMGKRLHSPVAGTSWGGDSPPLSYQARRSRAQLPLIGNQDILSETSSYLRQSRLVASRNQEISGPLASRIASCRDSVVVRSPLTCSVRHGVCQLCYGWSLSEGRLVTLGEAVGIIAAQSIGEPGTQLTMRTFHTGGVFSGDVMAEIRAPHDGVVDFPQPLQGLLIRTSHGRIAFLTKAPGVLLLGENRSLEVARVRRPLVQQNTEPIGYLGDLRKPGAAIEPPAIEGERTRFSLESLTVLFVRQHERVARTQLLAEFSSMGTDMNETIEAKRTLFSEMVGQVSFANVSVGTRLRESGDILQVSRNLGFIWILSGRRSPITPLLTVYGKGSHLVNRESLVARVVAKSESWQTDLAKRGHNITDQQRGLLDAFSMAASTSRGDQLSTTRFIFLPNLSCWAILSPPGRKNRIKVPSFQPNVSLSPDCLLFRSFYAGRVLQNYQQRERFLSAAVLVQNSSFLPFKGDLGFEEGEPKTTRLAIRRTHPAVRGKGPYSRIRVSPGQQSRKRPTWTGTPSSLKTPLGREDQGETLASNPDFYWFPSEQRSGESGLAWVDSRYIAKRFTHGEIIWINEQNHAYHGTSAPQVSPKQKLPQRSDLAGLSTRWPGFIGLTGVRRSAEWARQFAERVTIGLPTAGLYPRDTISTELWGPFPIPSKPAVLQKQHDSLQPKRSWYNDAEFRKEELVDNQRQYFVSIDPGWREQSKKDTPILRKLDGQVPGVPTRPIINLRHFSVPQSTNPLASLYAVGNQPDTRLGREFQRRGRSLEKTDKKGAAQFDITNSIQPFGFAREASHKFTVPMNGLNKKRNQRWERGRKIKEERLHALSLKTRPGWVYWAHDQINLITFHESTQFCSENGFDNLFFEPSLAYFEAFKTRQFSYSIADNLLIIGLRIQLLEWGFIEEDINRPRPLDGLASQVKGRESPPQGIPLDGWLISPDKKTTTAITTRGSLFYQLATQPAPEARGSGSLFSTNKWTSHEFVCKANQVSRQYFRPRLEVKPRIWPLGQQVLLLLRKMLWLSQNFTPPLANVEAAVGPWEQDRGLGVGGPMQSNSPLDGRGWPTNPNSRKATAPNSQALQEFGVPLDRVDKSLNPSILQALSRIRTGWRGPTPCYPSNSQANAYQLRFLKNLANRKPFLWLRGFPVQIQVITNKKTRYERGLILPSPIRSEFLLPYGFSFGLAGRCLPDSSQLRPLKKYISTGTALLGQNAEPVQRLGALLCMGAPTPKAPTAEPLGGLGGLYNPWATTWLRAKRIVQATESSISRGKALPPQHSSACVSQSRRRWFFGPALEKLSLLVLIRKGSHYPLSILEKSKAIFLRRYTFEKISINKRSNGLSLHFLLGNSFAFSTKQASTPLIWDTPSISCNVAPVVPFKSFQTAFLPNPLYWIRFAGYLSLPSCWSGVALKPVQRNVEPFSAWGQGPPQPNPSDGTPNSCEALGGKSIPVYGFEISLNGSPLDGAGSTFRWTDWLRGSKAGKKGRLSPLRKEIVPLLSPSVGELVSQGNSHPNGKKPAEGDNGENLHGQTNWQPGASRTGRNVLFTQADYASFVSEGGNLETCVGEFVSIGDEVVAGCATPTSGQIVALEGNKLTLRRTQALLFYAQGIMHVNHDEWVEKNAPILTLTYQKLVTGDIVQGIPKIEQFFEAPATKEGEPLSNSLQSRLRRSFQKLKQFYPIPLAVKKSLEEIQQILVEGILKVYLSQGVRIADKHLEIVIRQMISKGQVLDVGDTGLFQGEHVRLDRIERINLATYGEKADYEPAVLGITQASLDSESFISAASFQETTRVLSRDTIIGKTDFLRGLKERVVLGDLIQAGTGVDDNINYGLLFGIAPTYQGTVSSLF